MTIRVQFSHSSMQQIFNHFRYAIYYFVQTLLMFRISKVQFSQKTLFAITRKIECSFNRLIKSHPITKQSHFPNLLYYLLLCYSTFLSSSEITADYVASQHSRVKIIIEIPSVFQLSFKKTTAAEKKTLSLLFRLFLFQFNFFHHQHYILVQF